MPETSDPIVLEENRRAFAVLDYVARCGHCGCRTEISHHFRVEGGRKLGEPVVILLRQTWDGNDRRIPQVCPNAEQLGCPEPMVWFDPAAEPETIQEGLHREARNENAKALVGAEDPPE